MLAASWGKSRIFMELIEHGADPNAQDNEGRTVLMYAVTQERSSIVIDLIAKGANPIYGTRLRPAKNEIAIAIKATTKTILAIPAALVAMPPNPNSAATSATIKNMIAQLNIAFSLVSGFEPWLKQLSGQRPICVAAPTRTHRNATGRL
jgi:ankyrin repeat protein